MRMVLIIIFGALDCHAIVGLSSKQMHRAIQADLAYGVRWGRSSTSSRVRRLRSGDTA